MTAIEPATSKKVQQYETGKKVGLGVGVGAIAIMAVTTALIQSYGLASSSQQLFIDELQAIRKEIDTVRADLAAASLSLESCDQ